MPHIVVEYTADAVPDVAALLRGLHENLAAEESVDIARIKTRAHALKDAVVGDKGPAGAMLHITLKLMPRPVDVAKRMAQNLHSLARGLARPECSVTVEVVELNPETYTA